jgi:hypothetical protein
MSTARETYSLLRNFCIDIGAIRARIGKVFDSTIFYTVSYTYAFFSVNSLAISGVCVLQNATRNQVVETSCWFESGQGHQFDFSDFIGFFWVRRATARRNSYRQGRRV